MVVTTVTFTIGTASGISASNSSAATLPAGSYLVDIHFDPVTKSASADVSTVVAAPAPVATSTFDPATLAGNWTIHCPASTDPSYAACGTFFGSQSTPAYTLPIFLDVVTATISGVQKYAMAAWPSEAAFVSNGMTEGITPPSTITVTSLIAGTALTPPFTGTIDPTVAFPGFTAPSGGGSLSPTVYNRTNNTADPASVWNFLHGQQANTSITSNVNTFCTSNVPLTGVYNTNNTANAPQRQCMLAYLQAAAENAQGLDVPRPAGSNYATFGSAAGSSPAATIAFQATEIGGSPSIRARHALMGMEIVGTTAVAAYHATDSWTYTENNILYVCSDSETLAIVFIGTTTTAVSGRFTDQTNTVCSQNGGTPTPGPGSGTVTFPVTMTKQ